MMPTHSTRIVGHQFIPMIAKALGIDADHVTRVIIDAKWDKHVLVHVEQLGTEKLLEFDWDETVRGARILEVPEESKDFGERFQQLFGAELSKAAQELLKDGKVLEAQKLILDALVEDWTLNDI